MKGTNLLVLEAHVVHLPLSVEGAQQGGALRTLPKGEYAVQFLQHHVEGRGTMLFLRRPHACVPRLPKLSAFGYVCDIG